MSAEPQRYIIGFLREAKAWHRTDTDGHGFSMSFSMGGDLARFPIKVWAHFPHAASQAEVATELRAMADRVERGLGEQLC